VRYESKVDWWIPALLFGGLVLGTGDWIAAEEDEWRDGAALPDRMDHEHLDFL